MKLEDAALAAGATPLHPLDRVGGIILTGAATDNRQVKPGDLFVCIKGERADGHDFAVAAVQAGASAILAERDPFEGETKASTLLTPVLIVEDSAKALGRLGHAWRAAFSGKVVGITGTAGKTTVKELLGQVLAVRGSTARNPLNLNTQIGLPLSLLNTTGDEDFWVMEAGISQAHDMDDLGPILEPDLALILNVGCAHTQGLGQKSIAHYKARLLKYLAKDGTALASADYPDLIKEARAVCHQLTFFSTAGKQLSYRASYLGLSPDSAPDKARGLYRLWLDGDSLDVACALTGSYGAENVIAVAAAAHLLGLTAPEIAQGLESAVLPAQRFARQQLPGWLIIDDSYNANPLSCGRMLEAMPELAADKSLVCVMGEMLELGEHAEHEHEILGEALAATRAEAIFWTGGFAEQVREGLKKERYAGHFQVLSGNGDFMPAFQEWARQGKTRSEGVILFKGSRGNKMETLLAQFKEFLAGQKDDHAL